MSNIKEYLENLDKKNFIILLISIFLLFIGIGYYLSIFFSKEKNFYFKQKISLIKKIRETKTLNNKIIEIENKNKILKTKYKNLNSDLVYLLSEIESSNVLNISEIEFLKILHSYIAIGANINASFKIQQNNHKLSKYNLNISGKFLPNKFLEFAYFIKTIESPKAIITIRDLNIFKIKTHIFFDLNVTIWSFR